MKNVTLRNLIAKCKEEHAIINISIESIAASLINDIHSDKFHVDKRRRYIWMITEKEGTTKRDEVRSALLREIEKVIGYKLERYQSRPVESYFGTFGVEIAIVVTESILSSIETLKAIEAEDDTYIIFERSELMSFTVVDALTSITARFDNYVGGKILFYRTKEEEVSKLIPNEPTKEIVDEKVGSQDMRENGALLDTENHEPLFPALKDIEELNKNESEIISDLIASMPEDESDPMSLYSAAKEILAPSSGTMTSVSINDTSMTTCVATTLESAVLNAKHNLKPGSNVMVYVSFESKWSLIEALNQAMARLGTNTVAVEQAFDILRKIDKGYSPAGDSESTPPMTYDKASEILSTRYLSDVGSSITIKPITEAVNNEITTGNFDLVCIASDGSSIGLGILEALHVYKISAREKHLKVYVAISSEYEVEDRFIKSLLPNLKG